jgi:hypothetical protein
MNVEPQIGARPGLTTSGESLKDSQETTARLRQQVLNLAHIARETGITINEAERVIDDHKGHSVSPRFSELVRQGALVRVVIGRTRPTNRFPHGAPRYLTRYDEETRRNVIVHWAPEFAPKTIEFDEDRLPAGVR